MADSQEKDPHPRPQGAALAQLSAVDETGIGTTIVGGQPPGSARRTAAVPVGIERVLWVAATDAAFRAALLVEREQAARARGLPLTASEQAMLHHAPASQIEAAIDRLDTTAPNLARRGFLRAVAASAVTLAAVDALSGCGDDDSPAGIRPDTKPSGFDSGGIRPDGLLDVPIYGAESGGIQPDLVGVPEGPTSYGITPDK